MMALPVRDLLLLVYEVALLFLSPRSAPEEKARRRGATANSIAAKTSSDNVKRRTVRSGVKLDSICAQAPSARVVEAANAHASAPPATTSRKLSNSNCLNSALRVAPSATRMENSRNL